MLRGARLTPNLGQPGTLHRATSSADGVPSLLGSGPPNQLINQARLLSSDVSRLAVSSRAVVGSLKTVPQLPADMTTIRQLGQPGVNATALNPQVSIGLDQTRLGRSVRNVRVHLRGTYTPLPTTIGGSVVVAINGETIDQWPVDSAGVIARSYTVASLPRAHLEYF